VAEAVVLPTVAFGPAREGQEIKAYIQTTLELRTFAVFVVVVIMGVGRTPLQEGLLVARSGAYIQASRTVSSSVCC
jgi:hypothetical protein